MSPVSFGRLLSAVFALLRTSCTAPSSEWRRPGSVCRGHEPRRTGFSCRASFPGHVVCLSDKIRPPHSIYTLAVCLGPWEDDRLGPDHRDASALVLYLTSSHNKPRGVALTHFDIRLQ